MLHRLLSLLALLSSLHADTLEIRNRYPAGGIHYLGGSGAASCTTDPSNASWQIKEEGKQVTLIHISSEKALGFIDEKSAAVEADQAAAFEREPVEDGWIRLRAPGRGLLHSETRDGSVQIGGDARDDWWSAQWKIIRRTDLQVLKSPNGEVSLSFSLANGMPEYSVRYGDELVLSPSPLGFAFKDLPPLAGPFRVIETKRRTIDEIWRPVWGQFSQIRNESEELAVALEETSAARRRLHLIFRAYGDGAAFRYVIPEQPNLSEFEITNELTGFNFVTDAAAWWCEDLSDTYERDYHETPLSEAAPQGMQTAATFRTVAGTYVSLHEAALIDWAGMQLKSPDPVATLSLKAELVPWFGSEVRVRGKTPMRSPWRTIQLAETPGGLIESSLILNLNDPSKIEDASWIRPSKFMGIWWGMITNVWTWDHDVPEMHGATTERAKRYIDACAELGIDGLLVEGWCEGWSGGIPGWRNMEFTNPTEDFDILEVARYGREKGIKLVGHHETGGDIPNYERQMEAAFHFYQKLGVDTIKTGYVTGDKPVYTDTPAGNEHHHGQYMVRHYQKVVELASKYQLMINAHEPIKATGISRTWPNFVAREGARGGEFNAFVGNPPRHTTILPFTRLLGGPMDYTPGLFDTAFQPDKPFATRANQLALYVVIWSPLQMAADHYQCYQGEPEAQFIKRVPVGNWDETRVPLAEIGDYIVTARRKGARWYVGAVNDENPRTLSLALDFLEAGKNYRAIVYADGPDADYRVNPHAVAITAVELKGGGQLELNLRAGGGAAIEIHPEGDPLTLPSGSAGVPPAGKPLMLRAKHSDRALTLEDTSVVQRAPDAGGQIWTLENDGDAGWKILFNGQVLGATGTDNGSPVIVAEDQGSASQRWRFEPISGSYFRVVNMESGRLLDVSGNSYSEGAAIHLWENAHSANQIWWVDTTRQVD